MTNKITITDHRTGQSYDLPLDNGTVNATDLCQVKGSERDPGLMTYDPGLKNTASCRSRITFIDGQHGILRYRGYPIEQLARGSDYLETAYLLIHGELPGRIESEQWTEQIRRHRTFPEGLSQILRGFPPQAHPMSVLISAVAALSAFYPDARQLDEPASVDLQTHRLIGMMPTIAAASLCHRRGLPHVDPDDRLGHTGNFLNMLRPVTGRDVVSPTIERALDVIFLVHADLEQNCSANVMRNVASSLGDPYAAVAAASAALSGPRHGGANERVLEQLRSIGTKDNVPDLLRRVKAREVRLMGFGHRVYRNYDPRARILKALAKDVLSDLGPSPLMEVAQELERIALEDDFFVERRLYPNVDFYSGIILGAIGFPANEFTVLFAIARTAGWLAQYRELLQAPDQSIARPRQIYEGPGERDYVPIEERS